MCLGDRSLGSDHDDTYFAAMQAMCFSVTACSEGETTFTGAVPNSSFFNSTVFVYKRQRLATLTLAKASRQADRHILHLRAKGRPGRITCASQHHVQYTSLYPIKISRALQPLYITPYNLSTVDSPCVLLLSVFCKS